MPRLLLIDDDEHLAAPLAAYLKRFDLTLEAATRPEDGLARLRREPFDALILDVMMPGLDGFELCRRLRRDVDPRLAGLPVLMLTARGDVTDRIIGLELGADDYLPKPFEPRELAARLQTILRRRAAASTASPAAAAAGASRLLRFDRLEIDLDRRQVRRDGAPVELTGTEFELLALLAGEPQRVFSRDDLLSHLRGHDTGIYTRAIDILVSRIRRKLEPLDCIRTLRNAGYAFAAGPAP
ncbi:response regulator transcription factor [Sphaerotilus uruguayifluvii]|uniref:OmpR family response regulator RpaB n=1 Tax=Sphaerotilus uruguayifluvii TaxID=2735897 RepID=A0ABX2FZL3_9BURK|nr:response regulator transcription factor [Leptothrix sp. C29]NRT55459.1 OmpR family response regulator RpaB [Leptothrix sp. C29]